MRGFYPYGGLSVFKNFAGGVDFALVNHANKGAAWGMLSNHQEFLLGIRVTIVAALLVWLLFINKKEGYLLPFGLIVFGALSNIIDTFTYGQVVDLFFFRFWGWEYPVFNVADSAICMGVVVALFQMIFHKK